MPSRPKLSVALVLFSLLLLFVPRVLADTLQTPTTSPASLVQFASLLNLTSVAAVMGITSGAVKLITSHTVPGTFFGKIPVWAYQLGISLGLTTLAFYLKQMQGDLPSLLITTITAGVGSSGVYELFKGNTIASAGSVGYTYQSTKIKGVDEPTPSSGYDDASIPNRGFAFRPLVASLLLLSLFIGAGCSVFQKTVTATPNQRMYSLYKERTDVLNELTALRKAGYIPDNWAVYINNIVKDSDKYANAAESAITAATVTGDTSSIDKAINAFSAAIASLEDQKAIAKSAAAPATQPSIKLPTVQTSVPVPNWTTCPLAA